MTEKKKLAVEGNTWAEMFAQLFNFLAQNLVSFFFPFKFSALIGLRDKQRRHGETPVNKYPSRVFMSMLTDMRLS